MPNRSIDAPQPPGAGEMLTLSHKAGSLPSKVYESELDVGGGTFLVCDMYADRYLVVLRNDSALPGLRSWKTVSQPGEYPSGNTQRAREQAIELAQPNMSPPARETDVARPPE
jgi:hypothetical protein